MAHQPGVVPHQHTIYSGEVDLKKALDLSILKDKTVLITGGASGFGAASAKLWAQHGANVMIGDINTKLGLEVVAELRKTTNSKHHHFFECDVRKWEDQAAFFKAAAAASPHAGIDIVVANAGIADGLEGERFEGPPDYSKMDNPAEPQIMRTLDINLKGVFYTTHLALSYLPRNPGSQPCSVNPKHTLRDRQLILVASVAGIAPLPRLASYCAAKHGVVGLFRTLRITAPFEHGVRVNMINPYFVKTAIQPFTGDLLLAGGAPASIDDVLDVLTRFATDQSIIGRGCVVGHKASDEQMALMKLSHSGPVWDVYADDFAQTDIFTHRIVGITNLVVQARGWVGFYRDIFVAIAKVITG